MSWKRQLLFLTIVSLAATAALAIGVLLLGDFGHMEGRILFTTLVLSACGLLTLPAAVLLEQNRAPLLAGACISLTAAFFAAFELTLWTAEDSQDGWKAVGTLAALTVASTQISALTSRLRSGDRQAVRTVYASTVGLVLLLALMAIAAIWEEIEDVTYYRALAALVVLNVFLVVLQPLLRRLTHEENGAGYRVRIAAEPGGVEELELSGRDFADAVATAIRKLEREGRRVVGFERL